MKRRIEIASLVIPSPNKILWSLGVYSSLIKVTAAITSEELKVAPSSRHSLKVNSTISLLKIHPFQLNI